MKPAVRLQIPEYVWDDSLCRPYQPALSRCGHARYRYKSAGCALSCVRDEGAVTRVTLYLRVWSRAARREQYNRPRRLAHLSRDPRPSDSAGQRPTTPHTTRVGGYPRDT